MTDINITGGTSENNTTNRLKLRGAVIGAGGAEYTLSGHEGPVIIIDPEGSAIDLLLPAEADSVDLVYYIFNTGAATEDITIKEDSDTTTIFTLGDGGGCFLHCDGTLWRGFDFTPT